MVATNPVPHYVIHVPTLESESTTPIELPEELGHVAIHIAEAQLGAALSEVEAWRAHAGASAQLPTPDHTLLLVSCSDTAALRAAGRAASLGFPRTCVLQGGLLAACQAAAASIASPAVPSLHRDALAVLLGRVAGVEVTSRAQVLDLRRHDERSLYGSIPGTLHLPVDQLASALALPAERFAAHYHFDKPREDDVLVMQSRTNQRAYWAAQLATDLGFSRVHVYTNGVYGWRFDAGVKSYASYNVWDGPPQPEALPLDVPDDSAGLDELQQLGLLA